MWTPKGLQRYLVLFFMDLSTRRVELGGIASAANGLWMSQIARNLTDAVDGFFTGKHYLIHDRDPLYTREFLGVLADGGVESVRLSSDGFQFGSGNIQFDETLLLIDPEDRQRVRNRTVALDAQYRRTLVAPAAGKYVDAMTEDDAKITKALEAQRPGSWVGDLFNYRHPRCGFSRSEQPSLVQRVIAF